MSTEKQLALIKGAFINRQNLLDAGNFVLSAAKLAVQKDSGYLSQNIFLDIEEENGQLEAIVYTKVEYAPYVEFGTGQKGAANHDGISPEVSPAYRLSPWWIHESMVDAGTAEKYHWYTIDTPQGKFYQCTGQPARPFLYPALHDNLDTVETIVRDGIDEAVKKAVRAGRGDK